MNVIVIGGGLVIVGCACYVLGYIAGSQAENARLTIGLLCGAALRVGDKRYWLKETPQ